MPDSNAASLSKLGKSINLNPDEGVLMNIPKETDELAQDTVKDGETIEKK